jgi:membrane-associated phospholipid phosphatase
MLEVASSPALAAAVIAAFALLVAIAIGAAAWLVVNSDRVWRFVSRGASRSARSRVGVAVRHRYPRAWSFLADRLTPGEYLGLHLTVGLLVAAVALALFAGVVENVLQPSHLDAADRAVPRLLQAALGLSALRFFSAITWLGSGVVLSAIAGAGIVLLLLRRQLLLSGAWVLAGIGGGLLNRGLKALFERERPEALAGVILPASWSFPSGHSMGSLVVYGMLAYVTVLSVERAAIRIAVICAATVLVVLIGMSRIYLGVHYFSDVIGGYAAGSVWLAVIISGVEVARRRGVRRP